MSKMVELMDQWLGIKANEPYETVNDFPTEGETKNRMEVKQPETVKTFWDEHLKKPEVKLPRPVKKERTPVTSRIISMYELIKEEREAEMISRQSMDDITAMKSLSMALFIGLTRHEDECLNQAIKIINRK